MSLNFEFGNVANWKELHSDPKEWSKTEHLIWAGLDVQLQRITEKNWKQYAQRYFAVHRLRGTEDSGMVSLADIKRRIGLWTNTREITDAQFRKFLSENLMERGMREVRRQDQTVC